MVIGAPRQSGIPVEEPDHELELDEAIINSLPAHCKVLSVGYGGPSAWIKTIKIVVKLEDGSIAKFFKKGASGTIGADMMKGAFEADKALYEAIPDRVPKPVAWGTYVSNPDIHFYMAEYVEMGDDAPSPQNGPPLFWSFTLLAWAIPGGKFGFHVTHIWPTRSTIHDFLGSPLGSADESLFDREESVNGPDEALTKLRTAYFDKAIPRYLRPLESDGRSITPCLIHSDLWLGNIKPRVSTGELCLFDSCAYWGHNEADLAICYNKRYKLGAVCSMEYTRQANEADPDASFVKDLEVEFDERNALYAIKFHVLLSIMYLDRDDGYFRKVLMDELRMILEKIEFDSGISKPEPPASSEVKSPSHL
ncbi:hypothetical protein NEMBOFW57_004548 [Staphylotrichum longicolle]|uniref:protein-ribulosamine 3-kinase n=1 Tax=Staphylotrichum longicolle TaxID=669026 RepID=A0AAD4F861_9PEZI|nr:hypothetical protein NEMBOFW57_004548 [Staphylotrichum longicolle]